MTAAAIMLMMGCVGMVLGAVGSPKDSSERSEPAVKHARRRAAAWAVMAVIATVVLAAIAMIFAVEVPLWSVVIAGAVTGAGTILMRWIARTAKLVGCAVVALSIAISALVDTTDVPDSSLLSRSLPQVLPWGAPDGASTLFLALAAFAFLGPASNLIVRAVVESARVADTDVSAGVGSDESWRLERGSRELFKLSRTQPAASAASFRGGRFVGPLERALAFSALLAGMPAVIAGLIAAKGVVRFPEISADRAGGVKAEEFLVGTLSSLLLTVLALLPLVFQAA